MKVFDDIYPSLLQKREEHAEAFDLVRAKMRSIVEDDIWWPHLGHDAHKKVAISLRADANMIGRRNAFQAFWIDVDSIKHRAGTEIAAPQVQRPTLSDANLQHDGTTISVSSKQCIVYPKIMDPFMDASPGPGKKRVSIGPGSAEAYCDASCLVSSDGPMSPTFSWFCRKIAPYVCRQRSVTRRDRHRYVYRKESRIAEWLN
jgi:hypothetical protein